MINQNNSIVSFEQDGIIVRKKQFNFLYSDPEKFKVIVCCRGGGKTWAVGDWVMYSLLNGRKNCSAAFFSKTLKQVKVTIEPIMRRWVDFLGKALTYNGSELIYKINLGKNDVRVLSLLSYENEDAKRGLHPDIIVCDEIADIGESMLNRVVMPMLSPALNAGRGQFVAIGTPKGKNLFYELYERGRSLESPDWKSYMLKGSDSGLVSYETAKMLSANMSNAEYAQEMECDFNANVLVGSVYGEVMERFTKQNINDKYAYNPNYPVYTAWDLGHSNNTSIWFFQVNGDDVTFIDFFEDSGHDISYYCNELLSRPYMYAKNFLPWDAGVQNVRTPLTLNQMVNNFGLKTYVLANTSVIAGINSARLMLKSVKFNKTKCEEGVRHLKSYRFKVDTKTGVDRQKPVHDEHSDAADAFRYATLSIKECRGSVSCDKMIVRNIGTYDVLSNNI